MGNQPSGGGGGGAPAGLDCSVRCPGDASNDPNQHEMLVGCGPIGTVANYARCPSDEWESVGESDQTCTYATGQPGCFLDCRPGSACDSHGNCSGTGKQLKCRRKNGSSGYQADKTQCCLRGVDSIDGKSCDPNYRDKRGSLCQKVLSDYCAQGQNLFSNECKTWALGDGKGNPEADVVINKVCMDPANAKKAECSCIITANKLAKGGLSSKIPIGCSGTGVCTGTDVFKTTQMRNQNCTVVDCTVKDIQLLQSTVKGININQVCSGNTDKAANPTNTSSSASENEGSVVEGSVSMSSTTKNILIFTGVIAGLAIIGGIAVAASRKPRRPPMYPPSYGSPMSPPQQMFRPPQMAPPSMYPNQPMSPQPMYQNQQMMPQSMSPQPMYQNQQMMPQQMSPMGSPYYMN